MGLKLSRTGTRICCFETCLFLFVLLPDFHFSDRRTCPPTAAGVLSEKLRSLWPDGLRVFTVCFSV